MASLAWQGHCPIAQAARCGQRWFMRSGLSILAAVAVWGGTVSGAERVHFREDFEQGLRPIWKPVEFEGATQHTVVKEGANSVLQARAASSASGLAVKLEATPAAGAQFSWKWKIDKIPAGGSDDTKKTFDHTGRVFVAFKTLIGPPRTINYVWGNVAKAGETFHHPSSGRSRFVVLQSGNAKAGQWIAESRDLAADWKLLFGNDDPPEIVGLGFMSDSDGTKTTVTGWYDDFVLAAPARR
jgi:hypothetical protein